MDLKHIRYILDNGMRITLIPIKTTAIISMGFFINAGSRNEVVRDSGVAHYLEHLMFKGTKNRPNENLVKELDNLGASYNAATSFEYTYYYINGSSTDSKKLLDILIDIYSNPELKNKDINKERSVIIEELNMDADVGHNIINKEYRRRLFKNTSLEGDIIGKAELINLLTKKDFIDFRKKYYQPKNVTLIISGNFDVDYFKKYIYKKLNHIKNSNETIKYNDIISEIGTDINYNLFNKYIIEDHKYITKIKNQDIPYVYIKRNNKISQTLILFAFQVDNIYKTNKRELRLISSLLSSGSSSILFNALRTKLGVTYFNRTYLDEYADIAYLKIYIGSDNERVFEVIKAVISELKKIKKNGIKQEEFKRLKKLFNTAFLSAFSGDPRSYLDYYGMKELENLNKGLPFKDKNEVNLDINKELENFIKIKRGNVEKIINEVFNIDKMNLLIYGKFNNSYDDLMNLKL
jgi:predicted Zn-dependent peptidase